MSLNTYNENIILTNALTGKADVDLSNCTVPYVIETYSSGTSWYRLYSDGWIEQGGGLFSPNTGWSTVTLLYPMAYTANEQYYNIVLHFCGANNSSDNSSHAFVQDRAAIVNIATISSTSFQYYVQTIGDTHFVFWEVKGYTA